MHYNGAKQLKRYLPFLLWFIIITKLAYSGFLISIDEKHWLINLFQLLALLLIIFQSYYFIEMLIRKKADLEVLDRIQDRKSAKHKRGYCKLDPMYRTIIYILRRQNFEQGFYDENMLRVAYELSPKSFHHFTVASTDGTPTYYINFIMAGNSHSAKDIYFLGLTFDEDYLDNIEATKDKSILFSKEKAKYSGVNINEGIQSDVICRSAK